MNIAIICSSTSHPVYRYLENWVNEQRLGGHEVHLVDSVKKLPEGGDILFLVSCGEIIWEEIRQRFGKVLVLHASDLPKGRGWSPHVWEILGGAGEITVTLLEAADPVDTGAIWKKNHIKLNGTELYDELNQMLFQEELKLMSYAVENFGAVQPKPQSQTADTNFYRKRTPKDSEIDPYQSIAQQFDLLRVCDPIRFPAFFRYRGATYQLAIKKVRDEKQLD